MSTTKHKVVAKLVVSGPITQEQLYAQFGTERGRQMSGLSKKAKVRRFIVCMNARLERHQSAAA